MPLITKNIETAYIVNHTRKELVKFECRHPKQEESLLVKVVSFLPGMKDVCVNGWSSFRNMKYDRTDDITTYINKENFNLEEYLNKGYVLK